VRLVETAVLEIEVEEEGPPDCRPVLLLHGWPDAPRDGRGIALAADAIDLLDALELDRLPIVGHDWGARAAYTLAALVPERVSAIVALALPYQPRGAFTVPPFEQARASGTSG
jgi:pimeloyl-ACP methyl ester carboxylesterase